MWEWIRNDPVAFAVAWIAGVFGAILTLAGLGVALRQIAKTRSSAEAARSAAEKSSEYAQHVVRSGNLRTVLTECLRLGRVMDGHLYLSVVRLHIDNWLAVHARAIALIEAGLHGRALPQGLSPALQSARFEMLEARAAADSGASWALYDTHILRQRIADLAVQIETVFVTTENFTLETYRDAN